MTYLYFPGCSLRSTGRPYEESMLAVFRALEIPLEELQDWNCCGATAYFSTDEHQAFAIAARNLALGEIQAKVNGKGPVDIIDPCNACATHTLPGQVPLVIRLFDSERNLVGEVRRP